MRAAAALELLHLFALVHDDVMDESASRRGAPSAHVQAAAWHREAGADGDPEKFGRNLAILLGDLAHARATRLAASLPEPLRGTWHELCLELIAGQRADLTGAAAGRRDRVHAERIADPAVDSDRQVLAGDGITAGFPWWAVWFLGGSGLVAWVLFAPPRKRERRAPATGSGAQGFRQ